MNPLQIHTLEQTDKKFQNKYVCHTQTQKGKTSF